MRRRPAAWSALLVAGLGLTVGPALAAAASGAAHPEHNSSARPHPAALDPTDPTPTESTPPPPPPPGVEVDAADVPIGTGYWQGAADRYPLRVTVRNTGEPAITASTVVTLPVGVSRASVTAGPCAANGLTFECPLGKGESATITVQVTVAPGLWRDPPTGTVKATATAAGGTATDEDGYGLVFPPGPPTPGIDLATSDPILPPVPAARTETVRLEVRLRNTGEVQAGGAIDVITPPDVQVATMPAQCATRERISPARERCDVGRVTAGQRVVLVFVLVVRVEARVGAPLHGTVQGSLTPTGQDTVTVQASYQIVVATGPISSTGPALTTDPPVVVADPGGAGLGAAGRPVRASATVSPQLSVLPIAGSIIGAFTVVGTMVILSLRRRLRA
jgi:hypothetical protein